MVIREEVELVEEVSNVDAAQWIHLREWQDTWESVYSQYRDMFLSEELLTKPVLVPYLERTN